MKNWGLLQMKKKMLEYVYHIDRIKKTIIICTELDKYIYIMHFCDDTSILCPVCPVSTGLALSLIS